MKPNKKLYYDGTSRPIQVGDIVVVDSGETEYEVVHISAVACNDSERDENGRLKEDHEQPWVMVTPVGPGEELRFLSNGYLEIDEPGVMDRAGPFSRKAMRVMKEGLAAFYSNCSYSFVRRNQIQLELFE